MLYKNIEAEIWEILRISVKNKPARLTFGKEHNFVG